MHTSTHGNVVVSQSFTSRPAYSCAKIPLHPDLVWTIWKKKINHLSLAEFGPYPSHLSLTEFGPYPSHLSLTEFGPYPSHLSLTEFGLYPSHLSLTEFGPDPSHLSLDGIRPVSWSLVSDGIRPVSQSLVSDGIRSVSQSFVSDGIRPVSQSLTRLQKTPHFVLSFTFCYCRVTSECNPFCDKNLKLVMEENALCIAATRPVR